MENSRIVFLQIRNKKFVIDDYEELILQKDRDIKYTIFDDEPNSRSILLLFIIYKLK